MSTAAEDDPHDEAIVGHTRERVRMYLHHFGAVEVDNDGDFVVVVSDVKTYVRAETLNRNHSAVRVFCIPRCDLEVTEAILRVVATQNPYRFGKLWIQTDAGEATGRLYLDHTLLGTYLDPEELISCVELIAVTARSLQTDHRFDSPEPKNANQGGTG